MKKTFLIDGEEVVVENLRTEQGRVVFTLDGKEYDIHGAVDAEGNLTLHAKGHNRRGFVGARLSKGGHPVFLSGQEAVVDVPTRGRKNSGSSAKGAAHVAPMPGTVQKVLVSAGDAVESGQHLVVMEAMKLQITIEAAYAGTVAEVFYQAGDLVADGELLVKIDGEAETA